jgi:hypothetical protein
MIKIGMAVMALRLAWAAVYAYSVWPAVSLISDGAANTFSELFAENIALVVVGYYCSTILATIYIKK